jgi:NTP pyrophosphatase (non-canonical NTP hydrolase)
MADDRTTVAELKAAMAQFVAERDWGKFHSPKNLSMGLAVEAAELMEHFLWVDNEESRSVRNDSAKMTEIADEMADVACYLMALANTLEIDLSDSIFGKLIKNSRKYPIDQYRGRYRADE